MQVATTAHGAAAPRRLAANIDVGPIQRVGPLAGVVRRLFARRTRQVKPTRLRETVAFRKTDPTGIQQVEAAVQRTCVEINQ